VFALQSPRTALGASLIMRGCQANMPFTVAQPSFVILLSQLKCVLLKTSAHSR
jgi:hypothetical protein